MDHRLDEARDTSGKGQHEGYHGVRSMMHDVVKEDTVSRAAKMSRLFLFKTSAANDIATAAGGCEVDCWDRQLGIFFKETHVQHVWEHWSRALSRSIAQK